MGENGRGQGHIRTIAMLGNHLPRHCSIATFTTDLSDAMNREMPELDCFVLAMNDVGVKHAYPPRVRFEIPQGDIQAYRRAADFLNVDVVSVQHEYGFFGGKAGHVLELLRELRMPIVTTLHTVLKTQGHGGEDSVHQMRRASCHAPTSAARTQLVDCRCP